MAKLVRSFRDRPNRRYAATPVVFSEPRELRRCPGKRRGADNLSTPTPYVAWLMRVLDDETRYERRTGRLKVRTKRPDGTWDEADGPLAYWGVE
ncbi:MAG TPA: hypothetical protein VJP77_05715 [Planctomycetota bacterium]|nr:hypothetical protein [Planctomycetota bacterium]